MTSRCSHKFLIAILVPSLVVWLGSCGSKSNPASTSSKTAVSWQSTFGGPDNDEANAVLRTRDQGYLILGQTEGLASKSADPDIFLVKSDYMGNEIWQHSHDAGGRDVANAAIQSADGGFLVVGNTTRSGFRSAYILKIDDAGTVVWEKTHGGAFSIQAKSVCATADGGFLIVGSVQPEPDTYGDVYMLKIGSDGSLLWERSIESEMPEEGNGVVGTDDGGFLLIGSHFVPGVQGTRDVLLVRVDSSGNPIWRRIIGGGGSQHWANSVIVTAEGGFLITGATVQSATGLDFDMLLLKTDSDGAEIWRTAIGFSGSEVGLSVAQANDGGYIVVGSTGSFGAGYVDAYLVKTNSLGSVEWERAFGTSEWDVGRSVIPVGDGGYAFAGVTGSDGFRYGDVYLVKTDQNGEVFTRPYAPPE